MKKTQLSILIAFIMTILAGCSNIKKSDNNNNPEQGEKTLLFDGIYLGDSLTTLAKNGAVLYDQTENSCRIIKSYQGAEFNSNSMGNMGVILDNGIVIGVWLSLSELYNDSKNIMNVYNALVESININAGVENQICKQATKGEPKTVHIWRNHGVVYKLLIEEYEALIGERGLSVLYVAEKEENETPDIRFNIME